MKNGAAAAIGAAIATAVMGIYTYATTHYVTQDFEQFMVRKCESDTGVVFLDNRTYICRPARR